AAMREAVRQAQGWAAIDASRQNPSSAIAMVTARRLGADQDQANEAALRTADYTQPIWDLAGVAMVQRNSEGLNATRRMASVRMRQTDRSASGEAPDVAGDPLARNASAEVALPEGSFSILDWSGYPAGVPRPQGPFRIVEGAEYDAARLAANNANSAIRRSNGLAGQKVDIHEIQPVKFGGSATDSNNKIILQRDIHRREVTPWWNRLQRDLGY
ncbi:hypothetical protein, partial [Xanthomonas sacchari]|uniref:hypothetical protein n=1 Tax=Xanthomonas sacchari TaxID=56458 RepID=UPI00225E55FB